VPQPDAIGSEHNRLQPGDASLLNTKGRHISWDTGSDGNNAGSIRAGSGLPSVSKYHLVNISWLDSRPFNGSFDRDNADIYDVHVFQGTAKLADGSSGSIYDDNFSICHFDSLLFSIL
jgi:hypothetical protein